MSRAYRLPLPTTEWLTPAEALRKARLKRPVFRGDVDRDLESTFGDLDVETAETAADGDGLLWSPSPEVLARFPDPKVFERLRRVPPAKLVLALPATEEPQAIQALSAAGFVLLRRDAVRSDTAASDAGESIWLTARADDYRVRECTEGDEAPILELFAPLFHVARSPAHWRWKYLENPWGRRWISLAESLDGELAAHYAGYPVPFARWQSEADGGGREDLLAVQIGDTMTAPEHRHVGLGWTSLLGRAVRHHFATFGRDGVAFYYGFNAGKIRHFNLRFIQGRWAGTVGYYRRHASPTGGRRGRMRIQGRGETTERVQPFDAGFGRDGTTADFDAFFDRAGRHYGVLVRRDAEWLRWRYATCPDDPSFFAVAARLRGRLVGWGVFRPHVDVASGRRTLRWVDALFDPEHAHRAADVLDAALGQPEARGAEEVACWFAPRPEWWLRRLDALGFERVAEPDDLGLIYLPFGHGGVDELFPDVYYTWGDSDLT